jgi:beta-aspartyl-peptidase (threonine type)
MDLPHVMLTNLGAQRIAKAHGLAPLAGPTAEEIAKLDKIRSADSRAKRVYERYFSTVGAVAIDSEGDFAAGASTGGVRAMLPGRVGDTPIIGAGIYADNTFCAVSCTGTGEQIIRIGLAKELSMNIRSMPPRSAASFSLRRVLSIGGSAGIILVTGKDRPVIMHTTNYMASGFISKGKTVIGERFIVIRGNEYLPIKSIG